MIPFENYEQINVEELQPHERAEIEYNMRQVKNPKDVKGKSYKANEDEKALEWMNTWSKILDEIGRDFT